MADRDAAIQAVREWRIAEIESVNQRSRDGLAALNEAHGREVVRIRDAYREALAEIDREYPVEEGR